MGTEDKVNIEPPSTPIERLPCSFYKITSHNSLEVFLMKVKVSLDGLPEVPQENLLPLRGRVLILMDSSALLRMANGEVPEPPSNERTLPCICDFIKRESINQEIRNVPSR
jgi:hypothetical protein